MIRAVVYGAMGRMGSITVNMVEAAEDMELAAAVDAYSQGGTVLTSLLEVTDPADVIIDFSHHSLTSGLLSWAVEHNVPALIATTGHDEAELDAITAAAEHIPVFHSANMSLGVALLVELAKKAAATMKDADIEIVEAHHNRKLDAPSGTALMLANAIKDVRPQSTFKMGRSGQARREPDEIGIHALRMGNLPGIHEVILTTDTQSITLKHETYDRALFAEGALEAARFLVGKPAGMYNMNDVVKA